MNDVGAWRVARVARPRGRGVPEPCTPEKRSWDSDSWTRYVAGRDAVWVFALGGALWVVKVAFIATNDGFERDIDALPVPIFYLTAIALMVIGARLLLGKPPRFPQTPSTGPRAFGSRTIDCAYAPSMGGTGLEPVTPSLSSWCSPN